MLNISNMIVDEEDEYLDGRVENSRNLNVLLDFECTDGTDIIFDGNSVINIRNKETNLAAFAILQATSHFVLIFLYAKRALVRKVRHVCEAF